MTTESSARTTASCRHHCGSMDGRPPVARVRPWTTRATRCLADGPAVITGAPVTTSWAACLWDLCGQCMSGPHPQQLEGDPHDERRDDDDEDDADEPATEPHRRAR